MKKHYSLQIMMFLLFCPIGISLAQETATIKKQPSGITIDGVGDETAWANAQSYEITNFLGNTPDDEYDFSASFKVAWNDTALMYLVETKDFDIIPLDTWYTDGLELYFQFGSGTVVPPDIGGDRENGFFQVAIRLNNKPATGGYAPDSTRNHAVTVISDTEDSWVTEGYAAWSQFNNESGNAIVPTNGYTFRFDVNVQDNEDIVEGSEAANLIRGYWSSETHLWNGDFSKAGIVSLSDEVLDDTPTHVEIKTGLSPFLYPNPANEIVTVSGDVNEITIYDVLGKKVLDIPSLTSKRVSLSTLQRGIYIVNFKNNGRYISSQKITKMK